MRRGLCALRRLAAPAPALAGRLPPYLPATRLLSFSFATPSEYAAAADEYLDALQEQLETLEDSVPELEVDLADGVLNAQLGDHGHWVINKQTPNQQIWWSSPLSGPKRFEFDGEAWRNTRDNGELGELLHAEVKETVGVELPPLEDFLDG